MDFNLITNVTLQSLIYLGLVMIMFSWYQQHVLDKIDPSRREEDEVEDTDFTI